MRTSFKWIALGLCWLGGVTVFSQTNWDNYELYGTRDRISHEVVLSIAQDHQGYLWVGTKNGLNRYNGSFFEPVPVPLDTAGPLVEAIYETVYCSRSGQLWTGTRSGIISRYEPASRQWEICTKEPLAESVTCFGEAPDGSVWFGGAEGSFGRIDKVSGKTETIGQRAEPVRNIAVFEGRVVLNDNILFNPRNAVCPEIERGYPVIYIGNDSQQVLFAQANNAIHILHDTVVNKIALPATQRNQANLVQCITPEGHMLVAGAGMVSGFDETGKQFLSLPISDTPNQEEMHLNVVFQDQSGVIWLGTNSGLLKIDFDKYRFLKWSARNGSRLLTHNYVRSIQTDRDGALWVGYKLGSVDRIEVEKTTTFSFGGEAAVATTNCVHQLTSGQWLFGCNEGLFVLNSLKGELIRPVELGGTAVGIWSIYEDKGGLIWVGTHLGGLLILNRNLKLLHRFRNNPHDPHSLSNNSVWDIFRDSKGTLWAGTDGGLDSVEVRYKAEDGVTGRKPAGDPKMEVLFHSIMDDPVFDGIGQEIWNLIEDARGRLWIGTTDGGIAVFDQERHTIKLLNRNTGYPFTCVSGISFDRFGFAWVSTINGLYRLDEQDSLVSSFAQGSGLMSNDFNFKASASNSNGHLFFGSKLGMEEVDPERFLGNDSILGEPVIYQLDVFNTPFRHDLRNGDTVYLEHNRNFLRIHFSLLDFRDPGNHKYQYRLVGFDAHQQTKDATRPYAEYTNIPPGTYPFQLLASNDNFLRNAKGMEITFIITPAFWQQIYFQVAVLLIVSGGLLWLILWRVRSYVLRQNEKERFQRELAEMELKALQTQMNPHFIFNALNAIQHYVLRNDIEKVNSYLGKFARLMRLILESSKHKFIRLSDEISLLEVYVELEQLRFGHHFDYVFEVGESMQMPEMEIPSLFIQPFIENAINHGLMNKKERGLLKVSFRETETHIHCTVDDNGIGRRKSLELKPAIGQHRSRSMEIIEEQTIRFREEGLPIEVEFVDKSPPETGTVVIIKIAKEHVKNSSS